MQKTALNFEKPRIATDLGRFLRANVAGQEEAIQAIEERFLLAQTSLIDHKRPLGTILLLGPTGVGKTHLAHTFATWLAGGQNFSGEACLLTVNCAEFQHSHEVAKLLGSPPGYLGHRETKPLLGSAAIEAKSAYNKHHAAVLLLDEVEKASDAVWKTLLSVFETGTVTCGDNTTTSFHRMFIIATSNAGSADIADRESRSTGFSPVENPTGDKNSLIRAFSRWASPEFMNRIDSVVVCNPLEREHIEGILDIELAAIQNRRRGLELVLTPEAREAFIAEGWSGAYGARHLRRLLEKKLLLPLCCVVDSLPINRASLIEVDWAGGHSDIRLSLVGPSVLAAAASGMGGSTL